MASPHPIAAVRYILHGLSVQPPHRPAGPGRVRQRLYDSYGLRTATAQKASLGFVDKSVLDMNQRTDLVLQSPDLTVVRRGEVAAFVVHGTHHRIETANAVTAAVGTEFDVQIAPPSTQPSPYPSARGPVFPPGTTTVSVVQGTVIVSNRYGSQRVLPNQWTHVRPGQAPSRPTRHNARRDVQWTKGLPAP